MPITFIAGFAAVFGTAEAIRHTQARSRRQEHRSRKNNLGVHCIKSTRYSPMVEGKSIVLSGDKLFVDTGEEWDEPFGYPFSGYYMPYPDAPYAGLVSQIMDDPPMMNWIYVDKDTHEVKFGTRSWAEPNLTGPFDCTRQDRRLTFAGFEGFCLVQEGDFWSLYFDLDDDMLRSKVARGTPVLEVELTRKEMRVKRPPRKPEPPEGGEKEADWKIKKPEAFGQTTAEQVEQAEQEQSSQIQDILAAQAQEQSVEAQVQAEPQKATGVQSQPDIQQQDSAASSPEVPKETELSSTTGTEEVDPASNNSQASPGTEAQVAVQPENTPRMLTEEDIPKEAERNPEPMSKQAASPSPSPSPPSPPSPPSHQTWYPPSPTSSYRNGKEPASPTGSRDVPASMTSSTTVAGDDDQRSERSNNNGNKSGYRSPSVEDVADQGERKSYRVPTVQDLDELEAEALD
ncbi:hypothetical protein MKZ38_008310 [Zalerion maritima]|uniref:Uncharacterized protein n=1 Tax=Zalerion maritima TaxID=339359 RepID=A0AAD5RHA2_9PEZI|nr:hypothetical protein MKZ38_008310 [Zalerion maritima]